MGYIAPVNNYQYQQYAERVTMKDYNPYYLTPVNRITPYDQTNKDFQDRLERELNMLDQKEEDIQMRRSESSFDQSSIPSIPPHIIPKYTGKGRHFNESI